MSTGHDGGGSGIRTHGPRKDFGFQDRRNRPLCHSSDLEPEVGFEPTLWCYPSALQKRCLRPLGDPGKIDYVLL
jgi:hypothetical protein